MCICSPSTPIVFFSDHPQLRLSLVAGPSETSRKLNVPEFQSLHIHASLQPEAVVENYRTFLDADKNPRIALVHRDEYTPLQRRRPLEMSIRFYSNHYSLIYRMGCPRLIPSVSLLQQHGSGLPRTCCQIAVLFRQYSRDASRNITNLGLSANLARERMLRQLYHVRLS